MGAKVLLDDVVSVALLKAAGEISDEEATAMIEELAFEDDES